MNLSRDSLIVVLGAIRDDERGMSCRRLSQSCVSGSKRAFTIARCRNQCGTFLGELTRQKF